MNAPPEIGNAFPDDRAHSANGPACARCNGLVYRIPRRFADKILSMFLLVHRYRCRSWSCGWEGLLRATEHSLPEGSRESEYDGGSHAPEPSRMAPLVPLVPSEKRR